eukprot:364972-Chlamydomonas_euryale.AAC.9
MSRVSKKLCTHGGESMQPKRDGMSVEVAGVDGETDEHTDDVCGAKNAGIVIGGGAINQLMKLLRVYGVQVSMKHPICPCSTQSVHAACNLMQSVHAASNLSRHHPTCVGSTRFSKPSGTRSATSGGTTSSDPAATTGWLPNLLTQASETTDPRRLRMSQLHLPHLQPHTFIPTPVDHFLRRHVRRRARGAA